MFAESSILYPSLRFRNRTNNVCIPITLLCILRYQTSVTTACKSIDAKISFRKLWNIRNHLSIIWKASLKPRHDPQTWTVDKQSTGCLSRLRLIYKPCLICDAICKEVEMSVALCSFPAVCRIILWSFCCESDYVRIRHEWIFTQHIYRMVSLPYISPSFMCLVIFYRCAISWVEARILSLVSSSTMMSTYQLTSTSSHPSSAIPTHST